MTKPRQPLDERAIDILKRLTGRIEDVTINISSIKSDLKFINLRLTGVEHNTQLMKVDVEDMKINMGSLRNEIREMENRLNKRIENVADLITIELGDKLRTYEKRIKKLEQIQIA